MSRDLYFKCLDLYFDSLDMYFKCPDLHLDAWTCEGCLDLCFKMSGLVSDCRRLYLECLVFCIFLSAFLFRVSGRVLECLDF